MAEQARRVVGLLLFLLITAPLVTACVRCVARRVRAAPRAVAVAGGLGLTVAILQLEMTALGLVGLLKLWPVAILTLVIGVLWIRREPLGAAAVGCDGAGPWRVPAVAAMAAVATQWAWWTGVALREGVQRSDSLTYHLPTALSFAHTGSVRTPVATTVGSPAGYYSDGMEVLHAMGMVLTRSDVISCVAGISFASLAVTACWCIGARYGRGWLASLLACVALAAPAVVQTQAGSALVDLPAAALALTAVAVALWAEPTQVASMVPISLIAGAAFAAKLLVLPVVLAALGIAVVRLGRVNRVRATAPFALLAGLEVLPWLIRNWVRTGSPLPMAHLPGFKRIHFDQVTQLGRSAGSYLWDSIRYEGAGHGLDDGLRSGLGLGWVVLVLATVGAVGWALRNARQMGPLLLLAVAAIVEYLASPFGAGGPGEPPFLFAVNLRYALLAMLAAGLLLACRAGTPRAVNLVGTAAVLTLVITALPSTLFTAHLSTYQLEAWPQQHRSLGIALALLLAVGVLVSGARLSGLRRLVPGSPALAGAVAAAALVALGLARSEVTSRFPAAADLAAAYQYTDTLENQRIGVVGLERTYPFAGRKLSNQVREIVTFDAHGVPLLPQSCEELLSLVMASRSTLIVVRDDISPSFDSAVCLGMDPHLQRVSRSGEISVWRFVDGPSAAPSRSTSAPATSRTSPKPSPAPTVAPDEVQDSLLSGVGDPSAGTNYPSPSLP